MQLDDSVVSLVIAPIELTGDVVDVGEQIRSHLVECPLHCVDRRDD